MTILDCVSGVWSGRYWLSIPEMEAARDVKSKSVVSLDASLYSYGNLGIAKQLKHAAEAICIPPVAGSHPE